MDIVYNCNEKYAVHTAVSITSLFENNREAGTVNVYILGNGLSGQSIDRYRKLAAAYSSAEALRTVNVIDLKDYGSALRMLFGAELNTGDFDLTVLARIFAPSHLPDQVERYIYLDADTIVTGSLKELYETELGSSICAMAAEPTIYESTRRKLGLKDDEPYYNSGMILVDILKWEKEQITGRCIDYFRSIGGSGLSFPDQDILNYVLKGRVLTAPQKYNFFSNYYYQSYKSLAGRAGWFSRLQPREAYEEARRNPSVIHFAGAERPWLRGNRNPYREQYRKYLELSPWRGTPDEKGHEPGLFMYHMMNLVTLHFPAARKMISDVYCKVKLGS